MDGVLEHTSHWQVTDGTLELFEDFKNSNKHYRDAAGPQVMEDSGQRDGFLSCVLRIFDLDM